MADRGDDTPMHLDARALVGMARDMAEAGHGDEARHAAEHAIRVARREGAGSAPAEASAHLVMAKEARNRGDGEEAAGAYRAAADLFAAAGDPRREGLALLDLGQVHSDTGNHAEAVEVLTAAARYADSDAHRAALSFSLARSLHLTGRNEEALSVAERGADLSARLRAGDDANLNRAYNAGAAQNVLASVLRDLGRPGEAADAFGRAAELYRLAGDHRSAADSLYGSGSALSDRGGTEDAIAAFRRAATMYADLGDGEYEALALLDLGTALVSARRDQEAIAISERAATLFHDSGDRAREGAALFNAAEGLAAAQRDGEAVGVLERVVTVSRETGHRHREAHGLFMLGTTLGALGRLEEALASFQRAAELFRELGEDGMVEASLKGAGMASSGLSRRS